MANSKIPAPVLIAWSLVPFCLFGAACVAGASSPADPVTKPAAMTFAECQASTEYPGGRYAVEFDNGVCTVQKADATTSTVAEVSYGNCDAVRAAGKAPLHAGDPGYSTKLDRDGDGTACDA